MQPYYGKKRRRVVRTFNFNRILAFVMVVCFAVALLLVLSSLRFGAGSTAVKARTLYFVTMGDSETENDAYALANDCSKKGGAGYVVKENVFKVVAGVYTKKTDADSVVDRLKADIPAAGAAARTIVKIKLKKGDDALVDALHFCAYTAVDSLYDCVSALDKKQISQALAVKRCELLTADAARCGALAASCDADAKLRASVCALLSQVEAAIKSAGEKSDYPLSARLRYALCLIADKTANAFDALAEAG